MKMEFGKVCCANEDCEKVLGSFPTDNKPNEVLELYCDHCTKTLNEQEKTKVA